QRHIQDFVAATHQWHQLHHQTGMVTFQFGFHIFRLPEGEQTFTGGDAQRALGNGHNERSPGRELKDGRYDNRGCSAGCESATTCEPIPCLGLRSFYATVYTPAIAKEPSPAMAVSCTCIEKTLRNCYAGFILGCRQPRSTRFNPVALRVGYHL